MCFCPFLSLGNAIGADHCGFCLKGVKVKYVFKLMLVLCQFIGMLLNSTVQLSVDQSTADLL